MGQKRKKGKKGQAVLIVRMLNWVSDHVHVNLSPLKELVQIIGKSDFSLKYYRV